MPDAIKGEASYLARAIISESQVDTPLFVGLDFEVFNSSYVGLALFHCSHYCSDHKIIILVLFLAMTAERTIASYKSVACVLE